MRATIELAALRALADAAAAVAPARGTLPALSCALVAADAEGRMSATATSLSDAASARADAEVREPGRALVDAATLRAVVARLPAEADGDEAPRVSVSSPRRGAAARHGLRLECNGVVAEIAGLAPEDFPMPPEPDAAAPWAEAPAAELAGAIAAALAAASEDVSRPALCGAQLELSARAAAVVGTDGRRLHAAEVPAERDGVGEAAEAVLPRESARRMARALKALKGDARVVVGADWVWAQWGGGWYGTKRTAAVYPAWRQCVPAPVASPAVIAPEALAAAVARSRAVRDTASTGELGTPVHMDADGGRLRLRTETPAGSVEECVEARGLPAGFAAMVNADILADALAALDGAAAQLHWTGEGAPVALRTDARTAIVMPIRK